MKCVGTVGAAKSDTIDIFFFIIKKKKVIHILL